MSGRRYLANLGSSWLAAGATAVLGLFYYPLLVNGLGVSQYGLFVLATTITGYMLVLESGVSTSVVRALAMESEQSASGTVLRVATLFYSAALALVGVVLVVLFLGFESVFHIELGAFERATLLLAVFFNVGVAYCSSLVRASFMARSQYYVANAALIARLSLTVVFVFAALRLYAPLYTVVLASGVAEAITILGITIGRRRTVTLGSWHVSSMRDTARLMAAHCWNSMLNMGGDALLYLSGAIIVARHGSLADVAAYGLAGVLIDYLKNFHASTISVLYPQFARIHGRRESLGSYYSTLSSVLVCLIVPVAVLLWADGRQLLATVFPKAGSDAARVMTVLLLPAALLISQQPGTYMLSAMNEHHRRAWVLIGFGVTHIVLASMLAARLGMIGVPISLLICQLGVFGSVSKVHSQVIGVPLARTLRRVLSTLLTCAIVAVAALLAAKAFALTERLPGRVGLAAHVSTYLVAAYGAVALANRSTVTALWELVHGS